MLSLILFLASVVPSLADTPGVSGSSLIPRGESEGFLRVGITAHEGSPDFWAAKRQDAAVLTSKAGITYTIDLEIGTPPQKVTVAVDTGSSDLWVNPTCATSGDANTCSSFPQFQYAQSSSLQDTGHAATLSYLKGLVEVEYVSDTITIGNSTIKNQIFGVGLQSNLLPYGYLGLAPSTSGNPPYQYVVDSMASQGLIASRAFTLDLRNAGDPSGAIIFGGIDTGKYIDALEKCPILNPSETPDNRNGYWITLTGIGITTPEGVSGTATGLEVPVALDSGCTVSFLPRAIHLALGESFPGAQWDPVSGFFVVDCQAVNQKGSIDFVFNTKVISVAYLDFIWNQGGQCVLGMLPTDHLPILGDTFLRSAYVVYDEDNRNLHLAQAANCGTTIVAIGSGSDAVPSSTGQCSSVASAVLTVSATTSLDVSTTISPTNTYTGSAIPTSQLDNPGPQASASSVPGSTNLAGVTAVGNATFKPVPSATTTSKNSAETVKVATGAFAALGFVILQAWGL